FTYDPRGVAGFESLHVGSTTTDSFTFTVTDSHGQTSTATETITISVTDPGPVASNGSVSTDEDTVKTGTLTFTAAEPSDTGDHLTVTTGTFTTADGGSVTIFANGTFSYDPTHVAAFETLHVGSTTTDSFTSTEKTTELQSQTKTERIPLPETDQDPGVRNGSVSTDEDTVKTGTLTFTVSYPSDAGHRLPLSFPTRRSSDLGSVTIFANGTFSYDPTHVAAFETLHVGSTTTDSFTFTVTDNHGASSTATETIRSEERRVGKEARNGSGSTDGDKNKTGTL